MTELGGRAWIFRAADDSARYIEFLEWKETGDTDDPRTDAVLRPALMSLNDFGSATSELWIEP